MAFMQKQIDLDLWAEIDGPCGIDCVPCSIIPWPMLLCDTISDGNGWNRPADIDPPEDHDLFAELCEAVSDYTENDPDKIYSIEIRKGFGARLSAPGYMDCTPWTVFETQELAEKYLEETYGDDDTED